MGRLGVILLLAAAAAAQPTTGPVVRCVTVRDAAPPRIDGELNEEVWDAAPPQVIDGRDHIHPSYRAAWSGPEDLSGRVRALLFGEHLYLAFEIRDDTTLHARGRAWWAGDSIELFLDTDRQSEEDDTRFTNDDFQLFLMPFHAGQRWGVVARGPDAPYPDGGLRGIELAHVRHADGYTVEVRIPLWNLDPLRPDAEGRIGFDIALNDVDSAESTQAETYMTLSGRFDLFSKPGNFADLEIGARAPAAPEETGSAAAAVDWAGLLLGLVAVALLAFAVRGAARRMAKRAHIKTATLCGLFAAAAVLCSFLPTIAALLDDRATRRHWGEALQQATAAATTHVDLDSGDDEARAERLVGLLRDGRVRVRPHYRFGFVSLATKHLAPGGIRYGIRLGPGEVRRFPLAGLRAPERLRLDLTVPDPEERGAAGAEVRLELEEGAPVVVRAPRRPIAPVLMDTSDRAGEPMRELVVMNRLLSGVLVVDACFGETAERAWQPLPLAFVARAGVPLDVWHGRPASHILTVPRGGGVTVRPVDVAGHRLWIAVGSDGAYPATPYGADVAVFRVIYAQDRPGPELRLVNGRDLESRLLSYGRIARAPDSIALRWEDSVRRPELFTLHSVEIDPTRPIERIEVSDLGVLERLRIAAVTVGHRIAEAPPRSSGLRLNGDLLSVRDEVRAGWSDLGFAVRSPAGTTRSVGPPHEVRAQIELLFGEHDRGALEVRMPHSSAWAAVTRHRSLVFGVAALLLTFAAVVAGAALLYRARHLRVKMLAALAAATVAPLLFLVVSLTHVLNDAAEGDLRETTLTDLHHTVERLAAAESRAREMAASVRDTLELVPANEPEVLRQHMDRSRTEIEAQGAFLHLPDLDAAGLSGLGNVSFFDGLSRPGLYYSPWDGLVALGLARTAAQRRCLVGLPAPKLLGAPREGVTAVLYGPQGEPLAATGGEVRELQRAAALRRQRERLDLLRRTGEPLYEARTSLKGHEVATSHALLKDGDKVVGLLGVYRSRAATESRKAAVLRTLLLSTLAALLLVVLAGGTLVARVTDRLQRVTHAAREIARGHLDSRAPVESQDEVGRLAVSFNTMADALDRRVRQLTDLQRGLQELTGALDRDAVARAAAELLARATGARRVEVAALESATDRLESLHRVGGEGAPLGTQLPATGPAREAVEARRPLAREGALFLPLVAADRTVGLAICSPVEAVPETFLDLCARQIGIALENARLYHAAVTDELTGLYTRPFFVRRLKEEVDRAAATDRSLSLLRIVISDYGSLAQRHGATAAAKAMMESAAEIEGVLPRRNILACGRPGELLALLVESDAAAARAHLSKIGAALQRYDFETRPTFAFRSVSYPRDGAAADILLDSLFEVTETWDETSTDTGPLLRVPPELDLVPSRSPTMRAALEVAARVAPTNATVLLSGETGTGKEVVADLIQANSNRRDQPYVKVNCAAIPETLVETELFGHERGAFTGADRRRIGRFEQAHRGTLFLDEIGDLPLPTQVKLLRTLQERRIQRVGGSQPLDVDVRILTATNKDLGEAVRRGAFREDLYHRVHVIELRVPPLRERREDIPDLIAGFRQEISLRHGLQIEAFAPDALDTLYRHPWPGNVRELRNIVERSMLLAAGTIVERGHIALPDEPSEENGKRITIEGLTPRQERVLKVARDRGGVTNGEVVEEERVSPRTALRVLQKLVERGLLVRVGRRRGAVYRPT